MPISKFCTSIWNLHFTFVAIYRNFCLTLHKNMQINKKNYNAYFVDNVALTRIVWQSSD